MKKLLLILPLISSVLFSNNTLAQKAFKKQKKYFPQELIKRKFYLGMTKNEFMKKFPEAEFSVGREDNFRQLYVHRNISDRIAAAVFYIDNEGEYPVYEVVLNISDSHNSSKMGETILGPPNYQGEWRFSPSDTGLDFQIAAWIFKNKLIIASNYPGSEWEEGFPDPE
ncbi:MAG: hypothetical protein AAFX87_04925 [Bacteroidota bacterium]